VCVCERERERERDKSLEQLTNILVVAAVMWLNGVSGSDFIVKNDKVLPMRK